MSSAPRPIFAHSLRVGDVLAGGGTVTGVLAHDGLGGPFIDPAQAVTIEVEVDYYVLRSWAPDAQVIITNRNR